MTDMEVCSWPATTDSRPMNRGTPLSLARYSITGYWNSCTDCQRHISGFAWLLRAVVELPSPLPVLPLTAAAPMVAAHVVCGPCPLTNGYAGVSSVASSTSVQLRLPLPPCPACTNQSSPQGVSTRSVAFFTSFCIEIEPSEQVEWLWKSPAT